MDFSVFEALMLICFGISWPFAIVRSWKAGSAKGKSIAYLVLLCLAYIAGILHKTLVSLDIVLALYMLNFLMVSADIALYIRNTRLDSLNEQNEKDSIKELTT